MQVSGAQALPGRPHTAGGLLTRTPSPPPGPTGGPPGAAGAGRRLCRARRGPGSQRSAAAEGRGPRLLPVPPVAERGEERAWRESSHKCPQGHPGAPASLGLRSCLGRVGAGEPSTLGQEGASPWAGSSVLPPRGGGGPGRTGWGPVLLADGGRGGLCVSGCPQGRFGPGCEQRCQCEHGGACDHVSGACTCPAGWRGTFCERGERGRGPGPESGWQGLVTWLCGSPPLPRSLPRRLLRTGLPPRLRLCGRGALRRCERRLPLPRGPPGPPLRPECVSRQPRAVPTRAGAVAPPQSHP